MNQIVDRAPEVQSTEEAPFVLGGIADHATPLIRNCWCVAARASEVSREILSRRILGVDVALYRTLAGEAVAVRNRCPHRSFPLAKGKLEGDVLVCGYHGTQFDPSGRCVKMPAMPIVPTNANVRSFPTVARGPLVWIWMGDPDHADATRVPDTSWLHSPEWKTVTGCFHIRSAYVAMHENLLDQTHFPFLHPGAIGTPAYARRFSDARFVSPALHTAYARIVDNKHPSGEPRTYRFNITHIFTPETNHVIHYWWFVSRNFGLEDEAIDEHLHQGSTKAYQEDVDALEWLMDVVRSDSQPQFDLNFAPDKPGLMMRQVLYRMAAAEAGVKA